MHFVPQQHAIFHHLNFQKWSEHVVFCTFWLRNVLRVTTACAFSSFQLPKVVWDRLFFTLLTSKCASCHNGVQFFISYLPRWLRTRRFSKPTFRPSGVPKHWKNRVFCDFSTFLLSSDLFSPLIFYLLLFSSLALPTSAFLSVHIVGSLTSKLPSIIVTYHSYLSLLPIVVILPIFNHCFLS